MERKLIEISWASLWRIFFFALLVGVMYLGRQILLGLFLALVISSGLEVMVNFLEAKGLPRTLGVVLVFLLGVLVVVLLIYTVIPLAIVDLNSLLLTLNRGANSVSHQATPVLTPRTSQMLSTFIDDLSRALFAGDVSPFSIFSQALGGVALAMAVIISSFYLSLSRDGVERFIRVIIPQQYEEFALRIYERSRKKIGFWFRTQILLSLVMGVLVWGVLSFLGVDHAFLLGILAAVFELVPFVGPILAGAVAVLFALVNSVALAFYTLLVFLALHQFESHVMVPVFTRHSVGLHPVIVIVALLIGIEAGGVLGVLIAVPAAAVFQEIVEDWSSARKAHAVAG